VVNLAITGAVGLIAIFLDVATSTSFINFGAFTAFTLVNVSVIAYYVREKRTGRSLNPCSYLVIPAVGALVDAFLLTQLDPTAITLGLVWLAIGIVVLAVITRGFRSAPPELASVEKEVVS
jgi:putrescine importer